MYMHRNTKLQVSKCVVYLKLGRGQLKLYQQVHIIDMVGVVCIYYDCYDMYSREMHMAGSVITLLFPRQPFRLTLSIKNGQESSRILQNGKTTTVKNL